MFSFLIFNSSLAANSGAMLFGLPEIRVENIQPFKKWVGMLERHLEEAGKNPGSCSDPKFNACHYAKWQNFLNGLKGKDRLVQIKAINEYFNRSPYISDQDNWGLEDYWGTPLEFLKKSGDCEDYAIIKYMSLKHLGFALDSLRIVAVMDQNLNTGHAILGVFLEDKVYILDNQIRDIIEDKKIRHYQLVFSINESAWWKPKRG